MTFTGHVCTLEVGLSHIATECPWPDCTHAESYARPGDATAMAAMKRDMVYHFRKIHHAKACDYSFRLELVD